MSHTYRPARPEDGRAFAKIIIDWGSETPWMAPLDDLAPMAAFWTEMIAQYPAWVAERDRAVVGFSLRDDDNLGGLYVARAARRQRVGKDLLALARADCDRLIVWAYEANVDARRFYRREGLVEVSREVEESSGLMNVEHRWKRAT